MRRSLVVLFVTIAAVGISASTSAAGSPSGQKCGPYDVEVSGKYEINGAGVFFLDVRRSGSKAVACKYGRRAVKRFHDAILRRGCTSKICFERSPNGWSCGVGTPGDYSRSLYWGSCRKIGRSTLFRVWVGAHD